MPGKRKRKMMEVAERRALVARLFLSGKAQHEIRDELGLKRGAGDDTVTNDLKVVKEQWKESAVRDFDTHRAEELAVLKHTQAELLQAWEKSKEPMRTVTERRHRVPGIAEESVTVITRTLHSPGDATYTKQVLECVAQQSELLGLLDEAAQGGGSAPGGVIKFEIYGPDGEDNAPPSTNGQAPAEAS